MSTKVNLPLEEIRKMYVFNNPETIKNEPMRLSLEQARKYQTINNTTNRNYGDVITREPSDEETA